MSSGFRSRLTYGSMSTTWPRSAYGGMMSPHMSNMSGAVPATIEATSLFCQSSGVGCSTTDLIFEACCVSMKLGSTLAVVEIQKSDADIIHVRSAWPLPWIVKDGRGVGDGVAPPAAGAAGLVGSAGL